MVVRYSSSLFSWPPGGTEYKVELQYENEYRISMELKEKGGELAAIVRGALLPRPSRHFFEFADAISAETIDMARIFCEKHGIANRVNHPLLTSNSSCVSRGGFLVLEEVEVEPSHRGNDLGLRLLHELFVLLKDSWSLAVLQPGTLTIGHWTNSLSREDRGNGDFETAKHKIARHWARLGFVQAGNRPELWNTWFLTSSMYFQANHPPAYAKSQWLSKASASEIELYMEPKRKQPQGLDLELQNLVKEWLRSGSSARTAAIESSARSSIVQDYSSRLQDLIQRGASIEKSKALFIAVAISVSSSKTLSILQTLVRLGGDIKKGDEIGDRPIHVAAASKNHDAIRYLISLGADTMATNRYGDTPLKIVEDARQSRDDSEAAMGIESLPPRYMDVIPELEITSMLMPPSMQESLIDGWMSPRMRRALTITAEIERDFQHSDEGIFFSPGRPTSIAQCVFGMSRLAYIPAEVLQQHPEGLYQSFVDTWLHLWEIMMYILHKGRVPTVYCIRQQLGCFYISFDERKVRHYFSKGGKIEHAVDALIGITRNVVMDGDDGWEYGDFQEEIESHPETPMDKDFDLAWFKCITQGGGELHSRGPYDETRRLGQSCLFDSDDMADY